MVNCSRLGEHTQKTAWMRFQFDSVEQSIVDAWIASFSLACNQLTVNSGTVLNSLESCRLWSQVYSRYDARQNEAQWQLWSNCFEFFEVCLDWSHVCLVIDGNPVWHQDFWYIIGRLDLATGRMKHPSWYQFHFLLQILRTFLHLCEKLNMLSNHVIYLKFLLKLCSKLIEPCPCFDPAPPSRARLHRRSYGIFQHFFHRKKDAYAIAVSVCLSHRTKIVSLALSIHMLETFPNLVLYRQCVGNKI